MLSGALSVVYQAHAIIQPFEQLRKPLFQVEKAAVLRQFMTLVQTFLHVPLPVFLTTGKRPRRALAFYALSHGEHPDGCDNSRLFVAGSCAHGRWAGARAVGGLVERA